MTRRAAALIVAIFAVTGFWTGPVVAHQGHDHKVMGTVTMAAADHVVLKDRDGKDVTVILSAATKFVRGKKPMTAGDLKASMRVVITAVTEKEQLVAKTVELGPVPAR